MAGKTFKNATKKECGSNIVLIDTGSIMWSEQLPKEIMHLILERLCISDYLHCRQVCSSWRKAVRRAIASKCCRPAPELPWLVPDENCFFNLSDQKIVKGKPKSRLYQLKIWEYYCVGSIEGWLIMLKKIYRGSQSLSFLNPVSRARVMLPPRSSRTLSNFIKVVTKVVASTVPTSLQCIVACICFRGKLAFCRPFDKSWTVIDGIETSFDYVEIIEGKLYATNSKFMVMFDIIIQDADGGSSGNGGSRLSYRAERQVTLHPEPYCSRVNDIYCGKVMYYLAKDSTSKELFIIFLEYSFARSGFNLEKPQTIQGVQVFKLELINNGTGAQWAEVVDLGARILFLSKGSNAFIYVNSSSDIKALQRNCICFACKDRFCPTKCNLEVFSLTNKSIQRYNTSPLNASVSESNWFAPNPW